MLRHRLTLSLLLAVAAVAAVAASVQGANTQGVSTQGVSTQGVSTQGVSTQGVSTQGVSAKTGNTKTAKPKITNVQTENAQIENAQSVNGQTNVVVVVSAKSAVKSLTAEQTTKIFLGKVVTFPNGQTAVPLDLPEGSPVRDEFYSKVVHKNPSQLTAYWAKVIFTGDGRPPSLLADSAAVRKTVSHNPSAIGYIEKSAVNRSVRVVLEP